jgi:glycogen debranching enzyme
MIQIRSVGTVFLGLQLLALGASFGASGAAPVSGSANSAEAWAIAARNLLHNTVHVEDAGSLSGEKLYLVAGAHQFKSLWARDFSMSVAGALAIGANQVVHDSLEALFQFQRKDGLLARGVDDVSIQARVVLALIGITPDLKGPLRASYISENQVPSIDSNAIVPWAASEYLAATGDREFARAWFAGAEAAIGFLEREYFVDGLIGRQPPYSDWEDSVQRTGRVAQTNIYYILSLRGLGSWAALLGQEAKAAEYALKAELAVARFRDFFWIPGRHILRNFEGDDHLTADANLMAVTHHLVTESQAREIMATLRESPLWQPMPGKPTWPDYAASRKDIFVKLVGLSAYHDRMVWLWITAMAAMAEREVGNCAGYREIMQRLSDRIAADGTVHEVFDVKKGGRLVPVVRPLYRAEAPFTWSSALYLEAASRACL